MFSRKKYLDSFKKMLISCCFPSFHWLLYNNYHLPCLIWFDVIFSAFFIVIFCCIKRLCTISLQLSLNFEIINAFGVRVVNQRELFQTLSASLHCFSIETFLNHQNPAVNSHIIAIEHNFMSKCSLLLCWAQTNLNKLIKHWTFLLFLFFLASRKKNKINAITD